MLVRVESVSIPAWSTLGIAEGTEVESGQRVRFAGDQRPMRDVAQALEDGLEPEAEVEDWQILAVLS